MLVSITRKDVYKRQFLSIVIFSLGLIGPSVAAFTFTDDLAVLGTNVEEISQLLNAEELNHKDTPVKLEDTGISLRSVSFSYDGTTEVLHGVSLTIRPGTMTALVGPSGSGKSTVAKLIAGYWDVTSGSITPVSYTHLAGCKPPALYRKSSG